MGTYPTWPVTWDSPKTGTSQIPQPPRGSVSSVLLPEGWCVEFWDRHGQSSVIYASTPQVPPFWITPVRATIRKIPGVLFCKDKNFGGGWPTDAAGFLAGQGVARGQNTSLGPASSMIVPRGWTAYLRRGSDGMWARVGSSVANFKDLKVNVAGTHFDWNDKVGSAIVVPPTDEPNPIDWQVKRTTTQLAAGRSAVDAWKVSEKAGYLQVEIDLSHLDFAGPPNLFLSIGGAASHYAVRGMNGLQPDRPTRFTVYLRLPLAGGKTATPEQAKSWGWTLHWVAFDPSAPMTRQGFTNQWREDGDALMTIVNHPAALADGAAAPVFTTLKTWYQPEQQLGVGTSYNAQADEFTVHAKDRSGPLTPSRAAGNSWLLHWLRPLVGTQGRAYGDTSLHAGRTPPGEGWRQYSTNTLSLRVDTSAAGLADTPIYISSLSGHSSHWETLGGSAIYAPDAVGFTVYVTFVDGRVLTVAQAKQWRWHIHWMAAATP